MYNLIEKIYFLWKKGHNFEIKLSSYQGYRPESIIEWKKQTGLPWSIAFKILEHFEIYKSPKIRAIIQQTVNNHQDVFSKKNCYVTGFGNAGKSGDIILYEYTHTNNIKHSKIIKIWELNTLPENSTIIFVEDIIGTGTQSVDYIHNKANQLLKPSHEPYLLSLCATSQGIEHVTDNTHFKVLPGIILDETKQHYNDSSMVFNRKEKEKIKSINDKLKQANSFDYDLGLMLAFYYAIPNNSMPIFWKDGYEYIDIDGYKKQWRALLPRRF